VNIIPNENYIEKDEEFLISSLKKLLGGDMEIKIKYVKNIPQTEAFKKDLLLTS